MSMVAGEMKVSLIIPDMRGGGAERVWLTLADEFLSHGISVDLVLLEKAGELLSSVPRQAHLVSLDTKRFRKAVYPLVKYFRREKPDAVLVAMWPLTVVCVLASRLSGSGHAVAVSDHGILSEFFKHSGFLKKALLRLSIGIFYRLATARIAVSRGVANDLSKLGGLRADSIDVVYNPIVLQDAGNAGCDEAETIWGDRSKKRLLSVGSFKAEKNYHLLIRAFARLAAERDAVLTIVGDGPLRRSMVDLVGELGLEERVKLPGFIQAPESFYRSADLFVLSSDHEGFGNVIVEALSRGLPVVSTDCPGGPSEILDGGKYGELVPCGDTDGLALAMMRSLDKEHDPDLLMMRAREFSPAIAADQYLQILLGTNNAK